MVAEPAPSPDANKAGDDDWADLRRAGAAVGKDPQTIRRWIDAGEDHPRTDHGARAIAPSDCRDLGEGKRPRFLVRQTAVRRAAGLDSVSAHDPSAEPTQTNDVDGLRRELKNLEQRLGEMSVERERLWTENRRLARQNERLERLSADSASAVRGYAEAIERFFKPPAP